MTQEFKINRLRYTWRGEWTTSVAYNRDAVVQYEGKTYICLEPHTAQANFYDDLNFVTGTGASTPRWLLTIDGRVWKNDWQPSTFYSIGNIVKYSGVVYVCTVPHTSGLNEIEISNWTTYSSVDKWSNEWTVNTVYGIGDIVKYGGIVYRCTFNHISAATIDEGLEANLSQNNFGYQTTDDSTLGAWEVVNDGVEYKGTWSETTRYKKNDLVIQGSNVYKALEGHTGVLPFELNLPGNGPEDSTFSDNTTSKWELFQPGTVYKNTWIATSTYQINDIVMYGGYSYRSLIANNVGYIPSTSLQNDSTSTWELVTQGYDIKNVWDAGTDYKVGDIVTVGGSSFAAISDSTGEDPRSYSIDTTYTVSGSSGTTLKVASTVGIRPGMNVINVNFYQGQTVIQVVDETTLVLNLAPNSTPSNGDTLSFVGINYIYWQMLVPSTAWRSFWNPSASYTIGDLVVWQNTTYRAVQQGSGTRPDTDILNRFWKIEVFHARENAGNTVGDIVTRVNGVNTALPIKPTNSADNATEDFLLQVSPLIDDAGNSLSPTPINWQQINIIQDVFYVAPDGIDNVSNGSDPDKPWKTIKYACDRVAQGALFPNAAYLLQSNKEYLVEEMYQWMLYQVENNISPFTTSSVFEEFSTKRDARIIIDALYTDITKGGNSRMVAAALSYFATEGNAFASTNTAAAQLYIVASLNYLLASIYDVLANARPTNFYQVINQDLTWSNLIAYNINDVVWYNNEWYISLATSNLDNLPDEIDGVSWAVSVAPISVIDQLIDNNYTYEANAQTKITLLMDILTSAIQTASTRNIPQPDTNIQTTIQIKTGAYFETLPIVVPENTALNGDELRGVVVSPADAVYTTATSSNATDNSITITSMRNLAVNQPIQFTAETINDDFGNIAIGTTYYVKTIDLVNNKITISETLGGSTLVLPNGQGLMSVYAGNCLLDMFYVRNGTGIRNMTLRGLAGTLSERNQYGTRRPTGGAYVSLDPGQGPDDTTTWILRRSPYIQNVTNFGLGCTGLKIDGTLHNGGNKSIVCNDFTQVISDGIGVWCTGPNALTECVSVFSYYNYAGYFAEDGGRIRATNGNSSYGTYGVVAEGFDATEIPITATVDNRSSQVQANVQSAFGASAQLLSMQYANAGSGYFESTTNLLQHSNNFIEGWTSDGNVLLQQNTLSPLEESNGWTITGETSNTDEAFIYQDVVVAPPGFSYTALSSLNVIGSGTDATFDITVGATSYTAQVNAGGTGYVIGNQLRILGSQLGGVDGINDCFLTVESLAGSSILSVSVSGTVPSNSATPYIFSMYVKEGTASYIDIDAIFSGTSSMRSSISYFLGNKTFLPDSENGGLLPTSYGKLDLTNGWTRIWFSFYDNNAQNNSLRIKIYPRGRTGVAGYTEIYGSQLEMNSTGTPYFYLQTTTNRGTAYADYFVKGAGTGAEIVGDELRSGAVFTTRLTDTGIGTGGRNYLIASNNAQSGDEYQVTLAGSDEGTASKYVNMRCFLQSGTGAGQYGYISAYNSGTKELNVLKESFEAIDIISSNSASNLFTTGPAGTGTLYIDQPIEFVPTYYNTTITYSSIDTFEVLETIGGTENKIRVASTAKLSVNMPLRFTGDVFGGVVTDFTYYIKEIIDGENITITTTLFGDVWLLQDANNVTTMFMVFPGYSNYLYGNTSNMLPNMPIQFTGTAIGSVSVGTQYYVNDVIDINNFTIATTKIDITVTETAAVTDLITFTGSGLIPLNPIIFEGNVFGGISSNTKYYISNLVSPTTFTITDNIISTAFTQTEALTNLITVTSTTGLTPNAPIQFTGNTFGGIVNGNTYYILAVNDATTFTISASPGGAAITLTSASGNATAKTPGANITLSASTGSFAGTTTNAKTTIAFGYGTMLGTYSTNIFGGISTGTRYYVKTIDSANTFSISQTVGGAAVVLQDRFGAMNLGEAGWDHINPGTPVAAGLDNSTVYYIEPRVTFDRPAFTQIGSTTNTLAPTTSWNSIAYGENTFIAVANGLATAGKTTNGTTWTAVPLPASASWNAIAYGNHYWVITSTNNDQVLYSKSTGNGWRSSNLPSVNNWVDLVYGNGLFVAISDDSLGAAQTAYSADGGQTWQLGTSLPSAKYTSIAYNAGKFIAVSEGKSFLEVSATGGTGTGATFNIVASTGVDYLVTTGTGVSAGYSDGDVLTIAGTSLGGTSPANDLTITLGTVAPGDGSIGSYTVSGTTSSTVSQTVAVSTNGTSWSSASISVSARWNDIAAGTGLFVATSQDSITPCYSTNGVDWTASPYSITAGKIVYGQGVFLALSTNSGEAWLSETGSNWTPISVTNDTYGAVAFGFIGSNYDGYFVTVSQQTFGSLIQAGCQAKARVSVTSGKITSVSMWEPGSNYTIAPGVLFEDPNFTVSATAEPRISNGTLGNPSFINRGNGYNTTSTVIKINGGGYADTYQTGTRLTVSNLGSLPGPGDNLVIDGVNSVFKVTSAETVFGTEAPNIKANLYISPDISVEESPNHENQVTIRTKYSQARLSGHDFLNVGYGNEYDSNYPGLPDDTVLSPQDQAVEINFGRVFYVSTDQDGNFKVGGLFAVEQATGIVTLSASQFGLDGLETLSLGGVAVGNASVVIRQFSTDESFIANSNEIISTQRAIKAYLEGRLSQGGSNTFTGQLIAGTILVGGPDKISSAIPNGQVGSVVNMPTTVNFNGEFTGWDGDGIALQYFIKSWVR